MDGYRQGGGIPLRCVGLAGAALDNFSSGDPLLFSRVCDAGTHIHRRYYYYWSLNSLKTESEIVWVENQWA
ncbi:MAG: hypothetical protein ACREQI_03415 [Candidatus Binataceae bacterium]